MQRPVLFRSVLSAPRAGLRPARPPRGSRKLGAARRFLENLAIIGTLLCAATLLSGCSALRFTYNQGPTLGYWWLDRYVDFNAEQSPRAHAALNAWFRWHRSSQLPEYADWLGRLRSEVSGASTPALACRWFSDGSERLVRAYGEAVPAIAELAFTLKPDQFAHMEKRYAKVNAEFGSEYLQPDAEDRREAAVKRAIEQAEVLYGHLEAPQRELLARGVADSPFDPERWIAERKLRQQDLLSTLHRAVDGQLAAEGLREELRGFAERSLHSPRPDYKAYQDRLVAYNCDLASQLHNSTSTGQRQVAAKKLQGWEEDFRALAAEAKL